MLNSNRDANPNCSEAVANLFDTTDRNYVIADGSIIAEGTSRELLKNKEAIKSYFGSGFTYK